MNFWQALVDPYLYMPHGCCYLWTPSLITLHVVGDLGAFFAYMSAPLLLGWLVRRRKDLPFGWMFLCFSCFIFFCGCLHLMEIVTIWYSYYWLEGILKLLTAIASVVTACLLPGVVKQVLTLPTPEALSSVNANLAAANLALRSMTTELAAAKELAEEDSRLKSQFLTSISHEIRTPLAGVLGMTELLLGTPLDESQRQLAQGIYESASALLVIINDILDLSKIESGVVELVSEPFVITQIVDNVSLLISPRLKRKQVALSFDVEPALADLVLVGDGSRLRQILLNLCANAVKFTDHGQVQVRVLLESQTAEKAKLKFVVQDTGIGLNSAARERLFQPFSQADGSTTRRYGGTGLGLSICKRLVDAMGGAIGVESEPGQGSTFWFTLELPGAAIAATAWQRTQEKVVLEALVSQAVAPMVEDAPSQFACQGAAAGRKILVVEDNAVLRDLTLRRLARLNFAADAVASGADAVAAAATTADYSLILMDCHMPQMDGYEATRLIRHCESASGRHLPIIAMTASNTQEARSHCLASGMDDFISKPFDLACLRDLLMRWLGTGETRRLDLKTDLERSTSTPDP